LKAFVRQVVIIEGEISAYVPDEYGVSQGSVLSSTLFVYYINDYPVGLNSTMRLFADDTITNMAA